jgi:WD40 repeat protein
MSDVNKNFGKRLKQEREKRLWSREDLAKLIGTTEQSIIDWETGTHFPRKHFQRKFCEVFGITPDELQAWQQDSVEKPTVADETTDHAETRQSAPADVSSPSLLQEQTSPQSSETMPSSSGLPKPRKWISRRRIVVGIGAGLAGVVSIGIVFWVRSGAFSQHPSSSHSSNVGKTRYIYQGHTDGVNALAWSPDGRRIATASDDFTMQVWDALTGRERVVYQQKNVVRGVAWSPDNSRIVAGCADGTVQILNATTKKPPIYIYKGHIITYHGSAQGHPWVNRVSWSPDGKYIASGDQTSDPNRTATIHIWEVATGKTLFVYQGHRNGIYAVAWSSNGQLIASSGYDGTLQIWEAANGTSLATHSGFAFLFGLSWSPDGKYVAVGSQNKLVLVVESRSGDVFTSYRGHSDWVKDVAWSPHGKFVVSGSDDGTSRLWETKTGTNIYTYKGNNGHINAVGWSPNSQFIASGGDTVQVWEAP